MQLESLPKVVEDIILDFKAQMEHTSKMKNVFKDINNIDYHTDCWFNTSDECFVELSRRDFNCKRICGVNIQLAINNRWEDFNEVEFNGNRADISKFTEEQELDHYEDVKLKKLI